jgi:phage gpG-like protein
MSLLQVSLDDRDAAAALSVIQSRRADMSPLLKAIGDELEESTRQRFLSSEAPDGTKWADNAESTLMAHMRRKAGEGGILTKKGAVRAVAMRAMTSKRPLIGENKQLSTKISSRVDGQSLLIGSPLVYASTHQYGRGNIPARPFLGLSASDLQMIQAEARSYLSLA